MARNKNSYPKSFWESIYKDYLENELTYKELAKKYGVATSSISYNFRKMLGKNTKKRTPRPMYRSPIGPMIRARTTGYVEVNKNILKNKKSRKIYNKPIGPKEKLVGKKYIQSRIIISPFTGCWEWTGKPTSAGYGQLMIDKKYWTAHRYSYTVYKGEIPDDLVVRHMCHNVRCCNPDHLKIGTHQDNYNDSADKYLLAAKKLSKPVIINNIRYRSVGDVCSRTGISHNTISKHSQNGVFNIDSYLAACKKANVKPKVTRGDNGKQT